MEVTENEAQEQIQRLIQSDLFRFSELQRQMLKYLADKSLRGEADQLKEYTIAVDALGKPESYDPRRDSAVRLQSGKLRQKIREYYLTTGRSDAILVDFPKGHFKLVFSHRETPVAPEEPPPTEPPARTPFSPLLALAIVLAGLCIYLTIALVRTRSQKTQATAALPAVVEEFWSPFLDSKDLPLVCVGTPLFVRIPEVGFFRDSEINSWDKEEGAALRRKLDHLFPGTTPEPWYFYTGIGEAESAFLIGNFLTAQGIHPGFADSSHVTWSEIGQRNLVFVGPPKFVLQIEDLPVSRDLILDGGGIRNLKPQSGEPQYLQDSYTDKQHHDSLSYGLISRLPGLHGKGAILALGGAWTSGTLAASQYVTLESHLRELAAHVRLPSGKLPPYFQAVVAAQVKSGTPLKINYVFHHVLQSTDGRERGQ